MKLRFLVVQQFVNGPWRWAIVNEGQCLAVSPGQYVKPGMAERELGKFIGAISSRGGAKIEQRPSIQLSLFPAEVPKQ